MPLPRLLLTGLLTAAFAQAADIVAFPAAGKVRFVDGEQPVMSMETAVFDPKWAWLGAKTGPTTADGAGHRTVRTFSSKAGNGDLVWEETASAPGGTMRWDITATAKADLQLTGGMLVFACERALGATGVACTLPDGSTITRTLPLGKEDLGRIAAAAWTAADGSVVARMTIDPPQPTTTDQAVRVVLVGSSIARDTTASATIRLTIGDAISYHPGTSTLQDPVDTAGWFPFAPRNDPSESAISVGSWLRAPQQGVRIAGDAITVDGRPRVLWGTNIEYMDTKPEAAVATRHAAFLASMGVNLVRQHKLSNPGWEGLGSRLSAAAYEPADLARFDFFNAELRRNGVMYGFSPIWDLKVMPGDQDRLLAYDELVARKAGPDPNTNGLVWFMDDVQDLHIAKLVALIDHRNPHTGLRYAEDPALAFVEIQNEDNAFWFPTKDNILRYPTYRARIAGLFSDWLQSRYGDEAALRLAWGTAFQGMAGDGAQRDETLAARTILPVCNPWLLDVRGKDGPFARRLQYTARFLQESQQRYHRRAAEAIRAAGYQGPLIASNWQGGEGIGHFLNLASDAAVGIVDRHNYLPGAQTGYQLFKGQPVTHGTTLADPGAALLSSGMQQVAGKPFGLSEWQAIPPHAWSACETAIVAAYGFGLQGWDLSGFFASNDPGFTPTLHTRGMKKFNNLTPDQIGLFPVLSRMVLRGDIAIGDAIAVRRLTADQAATRTYDFRHGSIQEGDVKAFTGDPSHNALAVGRVLVEFTERPTASTLPDLNRHRQGDTWISTTGQLRWTARGDGTPGWISINAPGTQGLIGRAPSTQRLGDLAITSRTDHAVVLATAHEQDRTLRDCRQAVVAAVARTRNSGMRMAHGFLLDPGQAPVIVEPVQATLAFDRAVTAVTALDGDGRPLPAVVPIVDGAIAIDTGRDQAIWYLVSF